MKPGDRLGKYQLISELGRGGAAVVFLARHVESGKQHALKRLLPKYAFDDEVARRFRKEAQIAASLNHPNIVVINEVNQAEDGTPFIAMEYFEHGSLKERMEKTSMFVNVEEVVAITKGILNGLDYAHSKGVVHRDIKPDNVMLRDHLIPVLTDFGIAKASIGTVIQTATDLIVGTPRYMSPEQCSKGIVDGRSDLYSVGVMLYQLLTGEPPFEADTPIALMLQHVNNPVPPLRAKKAWIPKWLEMVVVTALEKDPDLRYQSAREFVKAMDRRKTLVPGLSDSGAIQAPSEEQIGTAEEPFIDPSSFPELFAREVESSDRRDFEMSVQGAKVDLLRARTAKAMAFASILILLVALNWILSFLGDQGPERTETPATVVRTDPYRARGGYNRLEPSAPGGSASDLGAETASDPQDGVEEGYRPHEGNHSGTDDGMYPAESGGSEISAADSDSHDSGVYAEAEATCPMTVISDPPGANVAGLRERNLTTPFSVKVPPGPRRLEFFLSGFLPHSETFRVLNGRDNIIRVRLDSERSIISRAEKYMRLGQFVEPPKENALEVFESVLKRDPGNIKARSGMVALCMAQMKKAMMQRDQFDLAASSKSLQVIIEAADGKDFLVILGEKALSLSEEINGSGVVFIESNPSGADVTDLASMTFGKTPYRAVVPCGLHSYVVSHEGMKRQEANMRVDSLELSKIYIDFSK